MVVLLYDEDCGFCRTAAGWALRLGCRVETTPWQAWPGLGAAGITPEAAAEQLHLVDDTTVRRGHHAVAATLGTASSPLLRGLGRLLATHALERPAAAGYRWVARNRYRLPGGTAACALPARPGGDAS